MRRFRCLMMKDKRDRSPLCRNYELENMKTKREDLKKKKYRDETRRYRTIVSIKLYALCDYLRKFLKDLYTADCMHISYSYLLDTII